jgi:hypothetical protein
MTDLVWRMCTFLIGCMGVRLSLVYIAYKLHVMYLPYMAVVAVIIAFGFSLIYIKGWRTRGIEVRGDKIWWNALRPIHAGLWFTFAVMAFAQNHYAYILLLIDTLLGLLSFSIYHYNNSINGSYFLTY